MQNIGNPTLIARLKKADAPKDILRWVDRRSLGLTLKQCIAINWLLWMYKRMDKLLNPEDGIEFAAYYQARRKVYNAEVVTAKHYRQAFEITEAFANDVRHWLLKQICD